MLNGSLRELESFRKSKKSNVLKALIALSKHLESMNSSTQESCATFMVHNGLIREDIDLLQGRVGKSILMRHYFSLAVKDLRDRTLNAVNEMMNS